MNNVSGFLSGLLVVIGLVYIIFLRPKFKKERDELIFDNRVLGFIDGLRLSDINLGCTDFEMHNYVEEQLRKAHRLPGNQFLIEYTTAQGWRYYSHTGNGDHMLFALLCIAQYANERNNTELVSWCESRMAYAYRAAALRW